MDPLLSNRAYFSIQAMLLVIGTTANLAVVIVVKTTKQLHTFTNYFLVSLAISDLFSLLTETAVDVVIIFVHRLDDNNYPNKPDYHHNVTATWTSPTCLTNHQLNGSYQRHLETAHRMISLAILFRQASNLTVMCLAIGRYTALVKTMKRTTFILQRKPTLILTWCVPLHFYIADLIISEICFHYNSHLIYRLVGYGFALFDILFFFAIPMLSVVYCYGSIIKGIYCDHTILSQAVPNRASHRLSAKVVSRLVLVSTLSLVSTVPAVMLYSYLIIQGDCIETEFIHVSLLVVSSLDKGVAAFNPIIYSLLNSSYKREIVKWFRRRRKSSVEPAVQEGRTRGEIQGSEE